VPHSPGPVLTTGPAAPPQAVASARPRNGLDTVEPSRQLGLTVFRWGSPGSACGSAPPLPTAARRSAIGVGGGWVRGVFPRGYSLAGGLGRRHQTSGLGARSGLCHPCTLPATDSAAEYQDRLMVIRS
jgi:hypothetical protein